MIYTGGRFLSFLLTFFIISQVSFAATLKVNYDNKTMSFVIAFGEDFNVLDHMKEADIYKLKIKTEENIDNLSKEFWGYPVERVIVKKDNGFYNVIFEFVSKDFIVDIKRSSNILYMNVQFKSAPNNFEFNTGSIYLRIFIGILVILISIFILYGIIKVVFKNKPISIIPGVGRVLGKVDLTYNKSLFFYELSSVIYIIGVAAENVVLIDKITDIDEINIIKSGFSRKKEFSSYLRFFEKKPIKDDLNTTKSILEEKIESLRKK